MLSDPILRAFGRRLRRDPDDPILVSRRRQATSADVDRLARAIGSELAIAAGEIVALAVANGPGFLAAFLAVRRAGAVALLFDARAPDAEKRRTAARLGAAVSLDCTQRWPRTVADFAIHRTDNPKPLELSPEVAVIKLTSGSTGQPRGIVTSSVALVADDAALASTMGLTDDERILAAVPMSHSYGLSSVVMPALMRRSVLVQPADDDPLDPMIVARERRVTFLPTVPAYLQALLKRSRPPALPPSLRLVISAGAPLKPATASSFRQVYGQSIHVFYGASECGGITFDRQGMAGERGSLGSPVDGVEITLEPITGPSPRRESEGSITVRSPAVACGYLPEADGRLSDGRFQTSDLGVFADNELFIRARLDDLINVRGKKVNPREVETILCQLEGVEDVVTLGVLPPGQEQQIVRSFVACRPGRLNYETIQTWCRRHLAEHKVPRSIVLLEEIPRTARGKLDRAALLAIEGDS